MAKQVGLMPIQGSIQNLSFYPMNGVDIVRTKGGPSAQQVKKAPEFARFRKEGKRFGNVSSMFVKPFYRSLHPELHKSGVFGNLTGAVNSWVRQGATDDEVWATLEAWRPKMPDVVKYKTTIPRDFAEAGAKGGIV